MIFLGFVFFLDFFLIFSLFLSHREFYKNVAHNALDTIAERHKKNRELFAARQKK